MLDVNPFKVGNVYFCKIYGKTNVMTYNKSRPVLIVSTVALSDGAVMVAPITSRKDKNGIKCKLKDDCVSTIAVERMMPVNINNLTRFIGNISDNIMTEVRHAINIMFNGGSKEDMNKYFPFRTKYNVHVTEGPKNIFIDSSEPMNITSDDDHINDEVFDTEHIFMVTEQRIIDNDPVIVTIGDSDNVPDSETLLEPESTSDPVAIFDDPNPETSPEPTDISEHEILPNPEVMINLEKINHKPLIKTQTYTTIMDIINEGNIMSCEDVIKSFKFKQLSSRMNQYEKHYRDIIITGTIRGLPISDIYKLIETGTISSDFFNIDKPFTVKKSKVFTVDENMNELIEEGHRTKPNKRGYVKISTLSDDDRLWIINADVHDIANKFNVAISTAYSYKAKVRNLLGVQ